jgi:LPS export ABC transporter protein LptC
MKKMIRLYKFLFHIKLIWLVLPGLCLLFSCRNDIETIKALTSEVDLPDVTGKNIEMLYTDSGMLKGKLIASEIIQYVEKEEPYYEFPRGMKVIFYDERGIATSYIQAKYAIYYIQKQLWEGRGQVIAESPRTGEKLETEQLFWDQREKRIYSDKFSKMTNSDGVFIGEDGFESNEDFSKKVMKGYSGRLNVRDVPPGNQPGN